MEVIKGDPGMTEFKETVTKSNEEGTNKSGAQVQQQTRKVDTEVTADGKSIAGNVVWYIFGVIGILLGFRFVLKLFGANPESGFVDFIYSVTGVLTAPFDNIFGVTSVDGDIKSVFEPSILVAIAVYALLAWGIVKLMNVNRTEA
jgi:hypothetical protein